MYQNFIQKMRRSYKIILVIVVVLVGIAIVIALKADEYVEGKVAEMIERVPKHIKIEYDDIEFNTFEGDLVFKNSRVQFNDPKTDSLISSISVKDLSIVDIGYWEFIKNKNFVIQRLELNQPKIIHRRLKEVKDSIEVVPDEDKAFKTVLHIDEFVINDADVEIREFTNDSLIFSAKHSNIEIYKVLIDSSVTDLLPFKYETYTGVLKNLYARSGEFEDFRTKEVRFNPEVIDMVGFSLKTKYKIADHTKLLKKERDWYNIEVDSVILSGTAFGKVNDSINDFRSKMTTVYNPKVFIYRNKLVADDYEPKEYYSKMLRELPFNLTLDSISLLNGTVEYEEKVIPEHAAGKLDFQKFNAQVKNFSNTYKAPEKTIIYINTLFMGTTSLDVKWQFDVNDVKDQYLFEGELGRLNTAALDQFTRRNLNINLEGELNKTYFTIGGNKNHSHVDLAINYDDFKVQFLKDEGRKKKTVMTALVNIFVRKNSDKAENDLRRGSDDVARDVYRSFYGNLWKNMGAGLKKAITGSAKGN
ncbi:hypothetical protein SAMN03097699_0359 [Flavobacteriaceae bacterium MAR_2010_188]|nr:hypothetical protein SAMN03097699_0359 [Flavobacteriaceae bacterium MAR_2010_188]